MHVLLCNDDGIRARGLERLRRILSRTHQVTVVAPSRQQSGASHAITVHRPIYATPVTFAEGASGWKVGGTPVDCIKLAVEALLPKAPDLVICGINHGANVGRDIFYSGTVAAAMEAMFLGLPAMALSACGDSAFEFDWIGRLVHWWSAEPDFLPPPGILYNVNVPSMAVGQRMPSVMAWVRLGERTYHNRFERRVDARDRVYYWLSGQPMDRIEEAETDVWALNAGMVTVTPLTLAGQFRPHIGEAPRRLAIPPQWS